MKDMLSKLNSIQLSTLIASLFFLYFLFLETSTFKSESLLKAKGDEQNISLDISLLPVTGSSEIYELSSFLRSKEAMGMILESVRLNNIYKSFEPNLFDLNKNYDGDDQKFFQRFIELEVDTSSDILTIRTSSFNEDAATILNKILIQISQFYFDRKSYVTSTISSTNSICNLTNIRAQTPLSNFPEFNAKKYLFNSKQVNILLEDILDIQNKCMEVVDDNNLKKYVNALPESVSTEVISQQEQNLFSDYLLNETKRNYISDKLIIVSNPNLPEFRESKNLLLKFLVVFLLTLLAQTAVRVLKLLIKEF